MRRSRFVFLLPLALAGAWGLAHRAASQQPAGPAAMPGPDATVGELPPSPQALPPGLEAAGAVTTSAAQAPPPNPYPVPPEVGAWMICAASYFGPDAPTLARQVCEELRNRHHLNAYIFNHADEERTRMREEFEKLQQKYPGVPVRRRTVRVPEQCAVLVGGYKDFDSAAAHLKDIKGLPLPRLSLADGRPAYDRVNLYEPDPETKRTVIKQAPVNPFSSAMVVRNPAAPPAPKEKPKFDAFWKELNADEEYSLLKCRKRYTLVVKEYAGASTIQQTQGSSNNGGFLSVLGFGGTKPGETLNAAGLQAHELARLLRHPRLGFNAYVLHTRTNSIVTVGGFDALNDSEMQRVQQQLSTLRFSAGKGGPDPIGLMATPLPMEVPRP